MIFKVWQGIAWRRRGQSERNWSVLPHRHTLHFYHSEGDRQRLVWQGWSSLVCSRALTATWRGWMDCRLFQPRHMLLVEWYIYLPHNVFQSWSSLSHPLFNCLSILPHQYFWPHCCNLNLIFLRSPTYLTQLFSPELTPEFITTD